MDIKCTALLFSFSLVVFLNSSLAVANQANSNEDSDIKLKPRYEMRYVVEKKYGQQIHQKDDETGAASASRQISATARRYLKPKISQERPAEELFTMLGKDYYSTWRRRRSPIHN